ncbi:MAG: hypothetical protein WBB25_12085 [Sulfitobacter sp.]
MMKTTLAAALAGAVLVTSGPAFAASAKEIDGGHQAAVVAAVQKARLDRVSEQKVKAAVLAGEVTWPENYNAAIPLFSAEIYKLKMRDLKKTDLGAQWKTTCMGG